MASRSRWLVGSSSTRQLTPSAMSSASRARVRSPGERCGAGPVDVVGTEPELGQQRAGLRAVEPGGVHERAQQRVVAAVARAGAGRAGRPSRRGRASADRRPAATSPRIGPQQRGLARAVRSEDGERGPARRPRGRSDRGGTSRAPPRRRRAGRPRRPPGWPPSARAGAATAPTACRPPRAARWPSRWPSPSPAIFSERCDLRCGTNLSLSVFFALAFFTPVTAHSRCVCCALLQTVPLGGELLVALLLLATRQLARRDEVGPAAGVLHRVVVGHAQLEDPGDDPVEEGAVVRHRHDGRRRRGARSARAGRGRRSRGRWWARRGGARPGGTAGWRRARPAPPGRPRGARPRRRAGRPAGPTSASTAPVRASRSSPPMARKCSSASRVGLDRCRRRRPSPRWRASSASLAAATPVRRAR